MYMYGIDLQVLTGHLDGHPWMHALEFLNWSSLKQFG